MTINDHLDTYAGQLVAEFTNEYVIDAEGAPPLPPAGDHAWRVRTEFDETPFNEVWNLFLDTVDTTQISALVIGYWGAEYDEHTADPVALLTGAASRFPKLRSLFLGDIVLEESEVSWIEHTDIGPIFAAFPGLERLDVRGSEGLVFEPVKSDALKTLRFETGGLPATVVRALAASELPALEHLDLWLGTRMYGGDVTPDELAPVLGGERFPALKHLGLENSEIADWLASALAGAPVVARLESLSLAHGTLGDEGAEALLAGQPLTHLRKLDLHHHFVGDALVERLRAALPGVEIDAGDQGAAGRENRFITVSE
ncbi:STM4015 family protein [Actinomadura rayongensis]|uniref:Leucine-rich repeat domain-containing protein n=1 Tax=Actinomadura rayongensis TaxID=1429076 RepID=A0A6I4WIS3_9ACTN|nr:STM4015 family protein [Actinomadura rayongensis]MXQ66542.1 leucine-rich repeat domain-containing protein [Actinomadura rayongensis]